jgi:hypothetical protein
MLSAAGSGAYQLDAIVNDEHGALRCRRVLQQFMRVHDMRRPFG